MGGALAAYIGAKKADRFEHVVGVCVIDVVEGSAIEALNGMKNVLQSRPKSFASEEEAVEWSVRSGYIKKRESAKISMIGQIITQSEANKRQAADIIAAVQKKEESYSQPSHYPHVSNRDLGALQEEEDEEFGEEGEEDAGEHRETGTQKIETQKMTSSTNSNRQVKPHPESTGVSSSNKRKDAQENTTTTGTARKSEDNDGTELDTNNGKSQQETSQSVVPRDTTLKSEPEFQSAKYGTETTSNSVEAYKLYYVSTEGYNEVYSGTSDEDSKQYPNCEVIYDIRSEDNKMTVSKGGGGKTGSQGSNQKDADDASQKEGETKDEEIKDPERYTWRIDLFKTEPYWRSWFTGLSRNFLDSPGPKLLILAGVDRLDKELTVAQMQGKFQMLVLPKAGHAVQEDAPEKVADALASFIQRHRMAPTDSSQYQVVYPGC